MVSQLSLMCGSTLNCQTLCLGACPRYSLVVDEDVKKPNKHPTKSDRGRRSQVVSLPNKIHIKSGFIAEGDSLRYSTAWKSSQHVFSPPNFVHLFISGWSSCVDDLHHWPAYCVCGDRTNLQRPEKPERSCCGYVPPEGISCSWRNLHQTEAETSPVFERLESSDILDCDLHFLSFNFFRKCFYPFFIYSLQSFFNQGAVNSSA